MGMYLLSDIPGHFLIQQKLLTASLFLSCHQITESACSFFSVRLVLPQVDMQYTDTVFVCETGERGPWGDHVLAVLPAYSWKTHPHRYQVQEPKGHGHHRIFRQRFFKRAIQYHFINYVVSNVLKCTFLTRKYCLSTQECTIPL